MAEKKKLRNLRSLAADGHESIASLAERAGINPDHLYAISCGRVRMTADDIMKISNATGVPEDEIQVEYKTST